MSEHQIVSKKQSSTPKEYWLKGKGSANYAVFSLINYKVHVLALIDMVFYIDKHLSVEDARIQYKKLRAKGWKPVSNTEVYSTKMNKQTLHYWIYD